MIGLQYKSALVVGWVWNLRKASRLNAEKLCFGARDVDRHLEYQKKSEKSMATVFISLYKDLESRKNKENIFWTRTKCLTKSIKQAINSG
jgi:hypothetical protein